MVPEDDEWVTKKVLAPLLNSCSDGMKLTDVGRRSLQTRIKWFTKERYKVGILHQYCSHSKPRRVRFEDNRFSEVR